MEEVIKLIIKVFYGVYNIFLKGGELEYFESEFCVL